LIFWLLGGGLAAAGVLLSMFWPPAFAVALLAIPFLYIAVVLTAASYRLGARGGDFQRNIHKLLVDSVESRGRLVDVGCGSGQLLIRLAGSAPGEYVGVDYWGRDWEYSKAQCERNAELEGVRGLEFVQGSASRLPFSRGEFGRVVSCLTFHEVRDVPDKTVCLTEALRVLAPGGRFALVDLFDDRRIYGSRDRVLEVIVDAGGRIELARNLSEILELRFPLNMSKVLKHAVIVTGTRL
jgi:SAM-dependent methyltransferase